MFRSICKKRLYNFQFYNPKLTFFVNNYLPVKYLFSIKIMQGVMLYLRFGKTFQKKLVPIGNDDLSALFVHNRSKSWGYFFIS